MITNYLKFLLNEYGANSAPELYSLFLQKATEQQKQSVSLPSVERICRKLMEGQSQPINYLGIVFPTAK